MSTSQSTPFPAAFEMASIGGPNTKYPTTARPAAKIPAEKLFTSISKPGLILPSQISTCFIHQAASGPMIIAPKNIGMSVPTITPMVATAATTTAPRHPTTSIGDQQRQHEGNHRPHQTDIGVPSSIHAEPPSPSTGVQPVSIKNAVINPQAINAAMFGIIMPDKNVQTAAPQPAHYPSCCLVPRRSRPSCASVPSGEQDSRRAHRVVATGRLPRPIVRFACASGSAPGPIAYAAADIAIAPFLVSLEWKPRSTNNDIAQVRPSARLLTNSDTR